MYLNETKIRVISRLDRVVQRKIKETQETTYKIKVIKNKKDFLKDVYCWLLQSPEATTFRKGVSDP